MIIEQIRYFVDEQNRDELVAVRREIARVRRELGMPTGHLLIADPPEEGPYVVWQCAYADESEMGLVESRLVGNAEYEAARGRVPALIAKVELELYTIADEEPIGPS